MSRPGQCPDAGTNPFRSSLHKLKSGRKVVTPPFISASNMVKMVAGAPNSRLRQLVKRDITAKGSAASEPRDFLIGLDDDNKFAENMANSNGSTDTTPEGETPDQRAERECRQASMAAEEQRVANAKLGKHRLSDRSEFECPIVLVGACMKGAAGSRTIDKKTLLQLQFLDWGYARGVACKGAKLTARDAEQAMQMMGTAFGYEEYGCGSGQTGCSCPSLLTTSQHRTECIWLPCPGGRRRFRAPELLEHWTFRSWFSGQKAQIVARLAKAIKNNASTTVADVAAIAMLDDASNDED